MILTSGEGAPKVGGEGSVEDVLKCTVCKSTEFDQGRLAMLICSRKKGCAAGHEGKSI